MKKPLYWSIAFVLVLLVSGCSPSQQQQAQSTANDALITAQVKAKIIGVDAATLSLVNVDVKNGRVTLSGQVHSPAERESIDRAARSVSGVVAVDDRLRVNAKAPTAKEIASDVALQAKVQTALASQTGINAFKIGVSAHNGVVVLTGTVSNPTVRTLAVQTAQGVSGVNRVIDRLQVQNG